MEPPFYLSPARATQWTGFYAGVNVGYGWSATTAAPATPFPVSDRFYALASTGCPIANGPCAPNGLYGVTALANSGVSNVDQNGVIGGAQIGYNWQWGPRVLFGLEADIQGADIYGSGRHLGVGSDFYTDQQPVTLARTAAGNTEIRGGINWMGGLRGRLGYLISPTWLLYGAGGLAFGGVHASTTQNFTMEQTWIPVQPSAPSGGYPGLPGTTVYPTFPGFGQYSSTRVGWAAGGGMEWMAMPNWSVKVEALYYDLGSASFASSPAAALDPVGYWGAAGAILASNALRTKVAYDGVIARVGLNYHFNWSDSVSSVGAGQSFAVGRANTGGGYWDPRFITAGSGNSGGVARSAAVGRADTAESYPDPRFTSANSGNSAVAQSAPVDRANTGKQFWDPRFW